MIRSFSTDDGKGKENGIILSKVCLGLFIYWFLEKAVKTKGNNVTNSSNNIQHFKSIKEREKLLRGWRRHF